MDNNDSGKNSSGKVIVTTVVTTIITTLVTLLVTKAFHIISPEESKVVISDTLRVVEAHASQNTDDSLLYSAISELNGILREVAQRNSSINIVWPESKVPVGHDKDETHSDVAYPTSSSIDSGSGKTNNQVDINDNTNTNRIIDKKGFYIKGYTISDGGVFFVLEKKPNASDTFLTFGLRLIQPADILSHIYLNICTTNDKGELYQFFAQTYEVKDGLNRITIANNLREGKNRIEIGVFMKSDEGKDYPTYYRNVFTLVK